MPVGAVGTRRVLLLEASRLRLSPIFARLIHGLTRAAVVLRREWTKVAVRAGLGLARLRLEAARLGLGLIPARLLNAAIREVRLRLRADVSVTVETVPARTSRFVRP